MTKNSYLAILALLLCNAAAAQEKKPSPHEAGLIIGRLAEILLGSSNYNQPVGITYKYLLNKKLALRTSYEFNDHRVANGHFTVRPHPDSSYVTTSLNQHGFSHLGRLGMEYRIPVKRVSLVIGMDLQARHQRDYNQVYQETGTPDSVMTQTGTYNRFFRTTYGQAFEQHIRRSQVGLGLSFGLLAPIGNHFSLGYQARFNSYFGKITVRSSDYIKVSSTFYEGSAGDVHFSPLISDVTLYYRF